MRPRETGASLVETALILPFLLLLTLGVIDISRAYFDAAKVQEAAQEGVVYASLNPDSPDDAVARAEDTIANLDFDGDIAVTCLSDDQVRVTVTHEFTLITPFIASIVGETIDLSHSEVAHVLSEDACQPSTVEED